MHGETIKKKIVSTMFMNFSFEDFEIDNLLAGGLKHVIFPTYTNFYRNQFCVCQNLCN